MNQKEIIETIQAMRDEVLDVLLSADLTKDKQAKKTLKTIDKMFERIGADVEDVIPQEVLENYFQGVDEATNSLDKAGVDPKHGTASAISSGEVAEAFKTHSHMEAIGKITDDTMLDLQAAIRTARKSANKSISKALDSAKKDLQKGIIQGKARKVITQRVAESFARNGMTSFTTIDGKNLPLDFYSQVVTRTNMRKANTQGAVNRYQENQEDLVKISERGATCDECAPYEGMVFSLSGDDDRFPSADDNLPPYHPQCGHTVNVFVADYKTDDEINNEVRKADNFDPSKDPRSKADKDAYNKQQDLHRKNRETAKQYEKYRAVLGEDEMPKTLGGFKRSKKSNSDNFKNMQRKYWEEMRKISGN